VVWPARTGAPVLAGLKSSILFYEHRASLAGSHVLAEKKKTIEKRH